MLPVDVSDTEEELLLPAGSLVAEPIVALLTMGVPGGVGVGTCTTTVNFAVAPAASVAIVHDTVPVEPVGGFVHVKVGPLFCISNTNAVFGGSASESVTFSASL